MIISEEQMIFILKWLIGVYGSITLFGIFIIIKNNVQAKGDAQ